MAKDRSRPQGQVLWADKTKSRFTAFIVAPGVLVAAGHGGTVPSNSPFLAAIDTSNGAEIWHEALPTITVKGGLAADHEGRIVTALDNGQIVAFAPATH